MIAIALAAVGSTLASAGELSNDLPNTTSTGGSLSAAETMVVDGAVSSFRSWLSNGLSDSNGVVPGWLKRIEIEASKQGSQNPVFSILTVQPLYQSEGNLDTFFTQLRFADQKRFGQERQTTNLGLGYRRLAFDKMAMFGANGFYDYEAPYDHARAGLGLEARTSAAEVNSNLYKGLSGKAVVANGVTERPLDGGDVELGVQVPYLPCAKVFGKEFYYKKVDAPNNLIGQTFSAQIVPLPFLRLEGGVTRDNTNPTDAFLKLTFSLGFGAGGTSAAAKLVSDQPFEVASMEDHTLDKVRRENTIVVERVATGPGISIVIGRSN